MGVLEGRGFILGCSTFCRRSREIIWTIVSISAVVADVLSVYTYCTYIHTYMHTQKSISM